MALMRRIQSNLPSRDFFDDLFNVGMPEMRRRNLADAESTLPRVNVREDENQYSVEMAAPGMNKEDFNIELDDNVLTISSEQKTEKGGDEEKGYTSREFSYTSFQRSFTLPEIADSEKINASYDNGILRLTIPKKEKEKAKAPKTINIK